MSITSSERSQNIDKATEMRLWALIRQTLSYPQPLVCKHLLAADLLSLLESSGVAIESVLAKAVIESNDTLALALIHAKVEGL